MEIPNSSGVRVRHLSSGPGSHPKKVIRVNSMVKNDLRSFDHMIDRCVENPNRVVDMSLKIPKFVQKLALFQKNHF